MNTSSKTLNHQSTHTETNKKKLRVLVVCHAYVTNINQGKLDAIAATEEAEVALLAPSQWKALGWDRIMKLENPYPRLKLYPAKIMFSGRVGAYFYLPWKVLQVIKDFDPDVIHVEQEVFSLSAWEIAFFARLLSKPMSIFGWENMDRDLSIFRQWIRRYVLDTAKLIIAGNKDGENLLRKWDYSGEVEVMPQIGVDTVLFPHQVRHRSNSKFTVGFVGRLVHQKGVDLLFEATRKLWEQGIDIHVVVCGSGKEESALLNKAQEEKIAEFVTWRSGISHAQVPEEMNQFDALVLPSRTVETWKEQFGHVLIESMSLGIPVVGSNSGEIPNVIGMPELVFAEEDAEGLARILKRMIEDHLWYEKISEYCIERVEQLYSHERIARRLLDLWREMI